MVIGRLKWFGGLNNQTGKINNFGFISLLEHNDSPEIYVNRKNINNQIEHLLEDRHNEGVYLEFDIDENNKKLEAINVNLFTLVGMIEWFKDGRGYIKCQGRSDVRITSNEQILAQDILYFGLRYNSKFQRDEAILIQKVNSETDDLEIIEKCINSGNAYIFQKILPLYVSMIASFPLEKAFVLVQNQLSTLKNTLLFNNLLSHLSHKYPDLFIFKSELLELLAPADYSNIINNYLESRENQYRQYLIDKIIAKLKECSEVEKDIYWQNIKYLQESLEYRSYLWDVAPLTYQKKIIKNRYQQFFQIVEDFNDSNYPYINVIEQSWKDLYELNDQEIQLIKQWNNGVDNSFNKAKMISARGAEKLVINYYQSLERNIKVEDISIHQITDESKEWIKGDVRLNKKTFLDVKNARTDFNSNVYSEFCIPQFKQNRGIDVRIAGVLSPYLQLEYMTGNFNPQFYVPNPQFLGTVTQQEIRDLESKFNDTILKINVSRDLDQNNYLPPWVFDYDEYFYLQQMKIINDLKQLDYSQFPNWEDLLLLKIDLSKILSLLIAAQVNIPKMWVDKLPQWQIDFINILLSNSKNRIKLPYLFLSMLKHFLSMLNYQGNDYTPEAYKQIYGNIHQPLKIYDPLNIINDFCDSLQIIWSHREKFKLNQFKIFQFNGKGLLRGKRSQEDKLTTILAYCGGKIEKKGKCGFRPLVIGKDEVCPECGHLVCPKDNCGFCSTNCNLYQQRKS